MTPEIVTELLKKTIETAVYVMAPILITAMVIGLIVSIFQTVTSIQEQTLTFLPKVLAVFGVILFIFPWAIKLVTDFTVELFEFMVTINK